jgi:hypothetical protein
MDVRTEKQRTGSEPVGVAYAAGNLAKAERLSAGAWMMDGFAKPPSTGYDRHHHRHSCHHLYLPFHLTHLCLEAKVQNRLYTRELPVGTTVRAQPIKESKFCCGSVRFETRINICSMLSSP